jgi:lipid-binding SYLF domain-containing protein
MLVAWQIHHHFRPRYNASRMKCSSPGKSIIISVHVTMVKRVTKLQKRLRCNAVTLVDRMSAQTYAGGLIRMLKKKSFSIVLLLFFSLAAAGAAEQDIVNHCATIIRDFRQMPEKGIPRDVLRHSKGLAIMTVVKAGFIFSAKGGQGVVVARTGRGWSGPSFIATGGAGWGLQIGAQVTDFVIVLNNDSAVRAFARGGNLTLGADVSAAAGPVGRTASGAVTPTAAVYTYSKSKGLFAGVSLEGAVIGTQRNSNFSYYGRPVRADEILAGLDTPPPGAAVLRRALGR